MKILVAGYYGFENLGDELILSVLLKQLRATYPRGRVTVLSHAPRNTERVHHVHAVWRWNPVAVALQMISADMFVLGGGGLLQDKTSSRSLFYYLALVALARLFRKQIFLYAVGVESLERASSRWLIRWILSSPRVKITLRDQESVNKLIEIGISEKNIRIMRDPVFHLTLSVPQKDRYGELARVLFIPRYPVPTTGMILYNEVRFLFEGRLGVNLSEVVFEPRTEKQHRPTALTVGSAEQMVDLLSACDLVVSARYHGLVLAALAGRPFIGLGDPEKTGRLCREMKMPFLHWASTRADLEAALGRVSLAPRRGEILEGSFNFVDKLF